MRVSITTGAELGRAPDRLPNAAEQGARCERRAPHRTARLTAPRLRPARAAGPRDPHGNQLQRGGKARGRGQQSSGISKEG